MTTFEDSALVDAACAGSTEAFAVLVNRYRAPVVGLAYRLTRDADEAKDIAQNVFLRAYHRLGDVHSGRTFAGRLFIIARNASIDAIRRRRRAAAIPPVDERAPVDFDPEDIAVRNDDASRVHAALDLLPSKYRDVLHLYYQRGLLYREIAVNLGIPVGTVKTYISRAKRRLRDELSHAFEAA